MITVKVNATGFVADFKALIQRTKNPRGMLLAVGREGANQLKAHFRKKQREEPNKLGGKRTNFWRAVADTVNAPLIKGATAVAIAITHSAIAQKVFGGPITAKRAGALTIPVDPEAYGRTAATFEHETGLKLFVLNLKGAGPGTGFLAAAVGEGVKVFYILRQSVNQKPDPTALPDMTDGSPFVRALIARAQSVLNRENSAGPKPPEST